MKHRMLRRMGSFVAIAAVLLTTSASVAQDRGGRGYFGMQQGIRIFLVQAKPVQDELKVTSDQQTKLQSASDKHREQLRGLVSVGEGTSREQAREQFEKNREKIESLIRETEKKIDEVLNEDQKQRLDQISLQAAGVEALRGEEVAAKLKLTPEQKQKIETTLDAQAEKRREAFGQGDGGREKAQQSREETEKQVAALLDDDQKAQWKEMQGETFDLASLRGQRRPQ
ncbi:MAG: hypothetical protein M3552_10945 [Planctomycetota bacterium]|nr:hypothetical protein [Planctomycetaceae bacterium]MDQ3331153.1 hypothetical protein [Planctomycetota bacterium]